MTNTIVKMDFRLSYMCRDMDVSVSKRSLERRLGGPWGSLGAGPGGSLRVFGASLGGSDASLGVAVSATSCFVMSTRGMLDVFVVAPRATTLIDLHTSVITSLNSK